MLIHRNGSRARASSSSLALLAAMAMSSLSFGQSAPSAAPPADGASQTKAPAPARARATPASMEMRIYQQLYYSTVDVDFRGVPARTALDYLINRMDVNVLMHFATTANPNGIDPDAPVYFTAEGLATVDALAFVLEQAATLDPCDWQVRRGVLEIGPKPRLAAPEKQEVLVYPIDDLLFEAIRSRGSRSISLDHRGGTGYGYGGNRYGYGYGGRFGGISTPAGGSIPGSGGGSVYGRDDDPRFEERTPKAELAGELIDTIVSAVEPQAWFRNGGDWAEIRLQDNMLVVRAPGFIHRQLGGTPRVDPPVKSAATPKQGSSSTASPSAAP